MGSEKKKPDSLSPGQTGSATKAPPKKAPRKTPPKELPRYRVLLHNDDHNEMGYVVGVIRKLTPLTKEEATMRMWEAHTSGVALLLVTHKERAELYVEQFASCGLTVTIEPES
ncbi:MAG TPA: ATP-dependent Clp protease adaptor ClpS [Phycisphaerae bacterium]|nr:ATP-dependent Clp protease adaptor ClpS [Phycisphaerae bacterium]